MNTERSCITVQGMHIDIVRKDIKNLHLGVYPPDGRVRVAAPLRINDEAVRLAVVDRLAWIKRQQARFEAQPRQSEREMLDGESHYYLGRRYRLSVIEHNGPAAVTIRSNTRIELYIRPEATPEQRERAIRGWYRQQLKELIPPLITKWQDQLKVQIEGWGVKQMKTKWGACNIGARRIWLNLELAKKPEHCIEYVVLHELTHLIQRHHNSQFIAILDKHLPLWRSYREELNLSPLRHENWND